MVRHGRPSGGAATSGVVWLVGRTRMIELLSDQDPWIATTSGERLLFMLLRGHSDWRAVASALTAANVQMARRYDGLASFFVGASVLHLQQRLIRQAQDVRELHPYDRSQQAVEMTVRAQDVVGLGPASYDGDYPALIDEVLTSAEQLDKTMGAGLKKAVKRAGPPHCHSCGLQFGIVPPGGSSVLLASADQVWPRALGGDSIEANLIPTCGIVRNASLSVVPFALARSASRARGWRSTPTSHPSACWTRIPTARSAASWPGPRTRRTSASSRPPRLRPWRPRRSPSGSANWRTWTASTPSSSPCGQ